MATRNRALVGDTNPILSKFASGYKNAAMIADLVCPRITSLTESGTYFGFGKEGQKQYNTKRAARTRPGQIDQFPTTATYECVEHSLETVLDIRKEIQQAEKYGAGAVLKLKQRSMMMIEKALAVAREKAVADILFGTSYYASGNKVALTGTDCWSDKTNSDPVGNVQDGKIAARADMGIEPNTLVLGYLSLMQLVEHPEIIGKLSNAKNAYPTIEDLKTILNIDKIVVGKSVYSTDAGVFTDLWTDNAALIYTPNEGELPEGVPVHSVQIHEEGYPEVREKQDDLLWTGTEFQKYVVKNISTSFGYLISNTKA